KDTRDAVDTSDRAFSTVLRKLDDRLTEISKIQDRKETPFQDLFDRAIFRADKEFTENVKKVQIKAQLSIPEQEHLSTEWENNMNLWIKGWEAEEIKKLRQQVKQAYFAGDRYGSLLTMITDSYGVSDRKALFLARQETNLLVSGYVQAQYQGNGFPEYRWGCVVGSPEHPVRPYHKALDRTIQRWDSPPVVDKYGNHKHPGQDFGCRCKATPILRVG
ncbi:MAG TPA: phage minor head protein, partial [Candidatus Sulfotelmatobacter sp.]|nr:phage minor head protein [Candidatus Sulfotelmatobacter sp.]